MEKSFSPFFFLRVCVLSGAKRRYGNFYQTKVTPIANQAGIVYNGRVIKRACEA
jgi:hypothetical protein